MEDNTDADYTYLERVNKDFVKKLGGYHDLYVQNDALLLSDLFGNFQKLYLEIYELNHTRFLAAPRLGWQAPLNKKKAKLDLMVEELEQSGCVP